MRGLRTALCVVVLASALCATPASARTFRCDEVWSIASEDNEVLDCFTNRSHAEKVYTDEDHLPHAAYVLLPILFFIIGVFGCPMACCGRCCCKCCGGRRRTPDKGFFVCGSEFDADNVTAEEKNDAYPLSAVRNTKVCATVLMVLGFVMLIVAVVGTTLLNESYETVFTETESVLVWVDTQALNIRTVLTINETGQLIPPLEERFFDRLTSTVNDFRTQIDDTKEFADPYIENVNIVALLIGVIPLMFLVLTVVAAVCDLRSGLLCCNLFCHWFILIPYAFFATIFLLLALVLGDVCGERDLFLANSTDPGLVSLALVPLCDANAPFESAKADIQKVITEQALSACNQMQQICDNTGVYDPVNNAERAYDCGDLNDPPTDCTTFTDAQAVSGTLVLKDSPFLDCRTDINDASTSFSPCNLTQCAQFCVTEDRRNVSSSILTNLGYASNGEYASNAFVIPLSDCNVVYTQALRQLVVCPDLVSSMQLVGSSFFGYSFLFLIGMCVICRGQKRFFKPHKEEEEDSDLEIDHEDEFTELDNATTSQNPTAGKSRSQAPMNSSSAGTSQMIPTNKSVSFSKSAAAASSREPTA